MNILRHKKWHVRTKENVARVRRDEAKAAEEEKARSERAEIAEHEDRVRRLKMKTQVEAGPTPFEVSNDSLIVSSSGTSHVNLFAELEEQERKNLTTGNKEYAKEKKKEQDDWESKVGIMKRFAEDTKEYNNAKEWWEGIPIQREKSEIKKQTHNKPTEKFLTKKEKKLLKKEKRKSRKRRKSDSSDSSSSSEELKKKKIEQLRLERIAREKQEQVRSKQLFEPRKEELISKTQIEEDRNRRYNSQFNPNFSK